MHYLEKNIVNENEFIAMFKGLIGRGGGKGQDQESSSHLVEQSK